ncbi:MAG: radical SAM protein [Nanoarchaeota archaeon]
MITIVDCYTDEPAGLGVPPYLGTYPRYLFGKLAEENINYITIDDLRKYHYQPCAEINRKTNIKIYNLTKNISEIVENSKEVIVIVGVHTPGKYLSALPGTMKEIGRLVKHFKNAKITFTGPAFYGTQLEGGKFFEKSDVRLTKTDYPYNEIKEYAIKGAQIIKQIPDLRIIEIETSRGCSRKPGCSFCTEPLKHQLEFRERDDILAEIKELYRLGCRYFRLGKQSCFYTYPKAGQLLKDIRKECTDIKVLHIDNVNPVNVTEELTKEIVKYCTSGNVAAFGVESFDPDVISENNLNCSVQKAMQAIKIINKYGYATGDNGMAKFLPGINILFGLKAETKKTNEYNLEFLNNVLKQNLLLRRINIRQVSIFEGTDLYNTVKNKFIRKNKRYYWKWRNSIRQQIDYEMLKRLVPVGRILKDVRMEIYDGNTTFGRQMGTYPLIVGVKKRLPLKTFNDVKVIGHMLRSVVGEIA